MGRNIAILVIVVAASAAAVAAMLFASGSFEKTSIQTRPTFSQDEVLEIVRSDFRSNGLNATGLQIWRNATEYVPFEEFVQEGERVPLAFVFPNGTTYLIDTNDYSISHVCQQDINCNLTVDPLNEARLIYILDIHWDNEDGLGGAWYVIDANSGKILQPSSPLNAPKGNGIEPAA